MGASTHGPGRRTADILSPMTAAAAAWWVRGVSLVERMSADRTATGPIGAGTAGAGTAGDPTDAWQSDYPSAELFRARLTDLGLDLDGLRALLAEPSGALADRLPRPSWVGTAERALAAAPAEPAAPPPGTSWEAGFALVLAPFAESCADELLRRARRVGADTVADLDAVRRDFTGQVGARLVALARRTLVLELNVGRATGRLRGDTPEQRFADFVRLASARSGLRALCEEYPVLARLLAQSCEQSIAAWSELLARLTADRPDLVAVILGGAEPGLLTGVAHGAGDRHQRGRSVAVLRFANGARVVSKPRPTAVHGHFNEVLDWFNSRLPQLGLRILRVLDRPGYGWVEYAEAAPCTDPAQVGRFYWRLGALLAVVHTLGGTDVHVDNLIACADQPVPVDLETLFHPRLARSAVDDPALAALDDSVRRTALLPSLLVGAEGALDLSALGGDRDTTLPGEVTGWAAPATDEMRLIRTSGLFPGASNRPRFGGTDADPGAHTETLLSGFRAGYDAITAHRAELTGAAGLLARFTDAGTRVLLRDTRWYTTLLDESTHPDVLRDALDRDRLFDALWRESAADPLRRPLVGAELADLWAGDVPLVGCGPDSTDLTVGRLTVHGLVADSGLAQAEQRLRAMGRADRLDQEWVIRASLATRRAAAGRPGSGHPAAVPPPGPAPSPASAPGPVATIVPDPERLLAAACGIADQIVTAAQDNGRRVNWLGLEPLDDRIWAVLPQGAGLPHGYCGTALFLAQLGDLTGIERYTAVARRALTSVPALLAALAARPADLADIGTGFAGLGGITYALSRLGTLLDDGEIAGWTGAAVELTATAAAQPGGEPGVLEGDAGCLAAMLAVHRANGSPLAAATALACADRLAARAPEQLPAGGFDTGAAGVGWALLRFAGDGGGRRHTAAGLWALQTASARQRTVRLDGGWCDGASGTALALADSGAACAADDAAALLERAVAAAAVPGAGDHSLCHGEVGALDLLLTAAASGRADPGALHLRAGALLAALDRFGPRCGTPDAVSSPGLLTGLAGIGYGLLRLGFAARIPSVLLLGSPTA